MKLIQEIFQPHTAQGFEELALRVFQFQYKLNQVYRRYCQLINTKPDAVGHLHEIPFLPIEFFKTHHVSTGQNASHIFTSSGTTTMIPSKHYITDIRLYEQSYVHAFKQFYGDPDQYTILALLPSYLERTGSSLIHMVNDLIMQSNDEQSGFFLDQKEELVKRIRQAEKNKRSTLLIGVSFALLDIAEEYSLNLKHTTIMETGGMKGRRKELIRAELHDHLKKGFGVEEIHSEYGMTELLSQAYSTGDGIFRASETMKILIRDPEDPFSYQPLGKTGGINVIDLANLYSCSFIATQDLGKSYPDESFEVHGRFDQSDIRGCNLMTL
ncbi:acyltransferase [Gangjinia marincola]|uniref:Acyltransferase n=1 Tax=Gangjinia marincola TaxID=578463 RepID=A0ABP3XY50_9FLAO